MKTIQLSKWEAPENLSQIDKQHYMVRQGSFEHIDMLNWPESYPYKPRVQFKTAITDQSLLIYFDVQEEHLKAVYSKDQDPVWQDSCVEFFCQFPGQDYYFNFEFNCIGTCLATKRKSRNENIVPLDEAEMSKIQRLSSLGNKTFEEKSGNFGWTLMVEIPAEIFGLSKFESGTTFRANFYKCGDETRVPHYLSWNLIATPTPDFHVPAFFGEIKLL